MWNVKGTSVSNQNAPRRIIIINTKNTDRANLKWRRTHIAEMGRKQKSETINIANWFDAHSSLWEINFNLFYSFIIKIFKWIGVSNGFPFGTFYSSISTAGANLLEFEQNENILWLQKWKFHESFSRFTFRQRLHSDSQCMFGVRV